MDEMFGGGTPRLYRNMLHESYDPDNTQFDPELAVPDHAVTSPTPESQAAAAAHEAALSAEKEAGTSRRTLGDLIAAARRKSFDKLRPGGSRSNSRTNSPDPS